MPIHGVLFDLDGTLLDTAPDFLKAMNLLRDEQGLSPLPLQAIAPFVSHGATRLIRESFGLAEDSPRLPGLLERFLDLYEQNVSGATTPYQGVLPLLEALDARQIPWGVVTNKPKRFTAPLMAALQLANRAKSVISGDTLLQRKPDPAPLQYACQQMGLDPTTVVYLGDAERDMLAGRQAGMRTITALFGYLAPEDTPEYWQADHAVAHPDDILPWLESQDLRKP